MKAVYQRFCSCGAKKGYTKDPDRKIWVCAVCGHPSEGWYLQAVRKGEVPPLKSRKRWGTPSPVRDIQLYKTIMERRTKHARAKIDAKLVRSTERGSRKAR